jgi:adenosine deaminase
MNKEYRDLEKTFKWTKKDFRELNKIALEAAFCDSDTKAKIAMKLGL